MKNDPNKLELLLELARGGLSGNRKVKIESELAADGELRDLYNIAKSLQEEGSRTDRDQLYRSAIDMSGRMFDDILEARRTGRPNKGIAIFDSGFVPLPEGVRPAAIDTRKLRYAFENYELELTLYPVSSDSFEIIGRLSGSDQEPDKITLRRGKTVYTVETDPFRLFRFARVPSLDYTLEISRGGEVIGQIDLNL
nr:hypothetical protein [candidate division Zixibacteria bacterium]